MTTVNIDNQTDAVINVRSNDDGTITIQVSAPEHYHGLVFTDGSYGIEVGTLDASNIRRTVDLPRGGVENVATATEADWSDCLAALWVRNALGKWSVVHEMVANYPDVIEIRAPALLDDLSAVTRVDRLVMHQNDTAQLVSVGQKSDRGASNE